MYNPLERLVNKKKNEEEKAEKEALAVKESQRKDFFDKCRSDKLFQEYIVDEILKRELDSLSSILNVQDSENMQDEVRLRKALYLKIKAMFIRVL